MQQDNVDWKELFGSDDDEIEEEQQCQPITTFEAIPGLRLIKRALTHAEQMTLVNKLINHNYFSGPKVNQAMCFGELPPYIKWLESFVISKYPKLFPTDILSRSPLFDQAILNLYKKGEGILSHVDLLRFEDGILIVSLLSSCVMTMRPARKQDSTSYSKHDSEEEESVKHNIMLHPGDILALSGDARYRWEHGIEERLIDTCAGETIERGTRISVTLRKLKHGEQLSNHLSR